MADVTLYPYSFQPAASFFIAMHMPYYKFNSNGKIFFILLFSGKIRFSRFLSLEEHRTHFREFHVWG